MTAYKNGEIVVSILGENWTIKILDNKDEPRFDRLNCDGFCDYSVKELVIRNYNKNEDWSIKDPKASIQHCILHEMVHAFMYESGLAADWEHKDSTGQEETVVDWIAWQNEKIFSAYTWVFNKLETEEIPE